MTRFTSAFLVILIVIVPGASCFAPSQRAVVCDDDTSCPANTTCLPGGGCSGDTSCGGGLCRVGGQCVSPLDTKEMCGPTCGPCTDDASRMGACVSSMCQYTCKPGFCPMGDGLCMDVRRSSDAMNCGRCGYVCPGGSTCSEGLCSPATLVTGGRPTGLALVDGKLYWTDYAATLAGAIGRVTVDGTMIKRDLVTLLERPYAIVADARGIYWTERHAMGRAAMAGLDGGAPTSFRINQPFPYAIAVSGDYVYWTQGDGSIHRSYVVNLDRIEVVSAQNKLKGLAIDSNRLYWAADDTIWYLPTAGGTAMELARGQILPDLILADPSGIHWSNSHSMGSIGKHDLSPSGMPQELASDQSYPYALAGDGSFIYWTNRGADGTGEGSIWRVAVSGGPPQLIARGQPSPTFIVVDANAIYWTNSVDNGQVMKLVKPPR